MYDAVIVGGGAVGCAVARWLSRYRLRICLAERGEDVCVGTSKANSAIPPVRRAGAVLRRSGHPPSGGAEAAR